MNSSEFDWVHHTWLHELWIDSLDSNNELISTALGWCKQFALVFGWYKCNSNQSTIWCIQWIQWLNECNDCIETNYGLLGTAHCNTDVNKWTSKPTKPNWKLGVNTKWTGNDASTFSWHINLQLMPNGMNKKNALNG